MILTFDDPKQEDMRTLLGKKKMLVASIFSFSHTIFYPPQNKFHFSATFILLSADAFDLDQA